MPHMPAITLTHPIAGAGGAPLALSLPETLLWSDQYGWQQVLMTKSYSTTGALHLDNWVKQAGRPMTLQGTQTRAWCARGDLATLRAWAAVPALTLSLNFRGTVYAVQFDNEQQAIEAEPLTDLLDAQGTYTVRNAAGQTVLNTEIDYYDPRDTDPFAVVLRFVIL